AKDKRAQKSRETAPLTKKQIARNRKVQRQLRMIWTGVGIIAALVVTVLAFGLYQEMVAKPASPIAVVNGVPIRTDYYQRVARYTSDSSKQLVDYLIEEELIRQYAVQNEITVTADEVQTAVEEMFGYYRTPPTPTPTPITSQETITDVSPAPTPTPMTEAQFQQAYSDFIRGVKEQTGLSEEEFRQNVQATLLRQDVRELVTQDVLTEEEQAHVRHILIRVDAGADEQAVQEAEQKALDLVEQLRGGADFATLAAQVSEDPGSSAQGGDVGWVARNGGMVPEFEEAAFTLPVGEISDPVSSYYGFHIMQVTEREVRALEPNILARRKNDVFQQWLTDLRAAAHVEEYWSLDKVPAELLSQMG
ncbi:MAG: peptidylprolyl isomerase, partial [Chloroflexota bacterium]|nr:peptidylprolyl isomerase [Chloroflexota bacterium]